MRKVLDYWKRELAKQAKDVLVKILKGAFLALATKAIEEYVIKPCMRKINQITKKHHWPDEDFDFRTDEIIPSY